MENISIKVSIAGRTYPLTVKKEESEDVQKASKLINERIKEYAENYTVSDKQDLLAMCAFQIATQNIQFEKKVVRDKSELAEELQDMESFISRYLKKQ